MSEFEIQPPPDRQPIIVHASRTAIGRAHGAFRTLRIEELTSPLIKHVLEKTGVDPAQIDDVILGNATAAGGNVGRLAALSADLPLEIPGMGVDRQCGSGLEAVILAARLVQAGAGECYLAGGVESVSTAPWRVERPTSGRDLPRFYGRARFSPDSVGDPEMGVAAENVATACRISRDQQDRFALGSHRKAIAAMDAGAFESEIVPVSTGGAIVSMDECPRRSTSMEALAGLKPVFVEGGTVTAGNACPLNDGAAVTLVMSRAAARKAGLSNGLLFLDSAVSGIDPNLLGLGPVESTRRLQRRQPNLNISDVALIEFNEAFASQVIGSLERLEIDLERVNLEGGALALGHPFGASGAILVTRLFSQASRASQAGALSLAMLGIGGGLGLTGLFQWVEGL
jgi:acetyl-CoA C-acetyltransferase